MFILISRNLRQSRSYPRTGNWKVTYRLDGVGHGEQPSRSVTVKLNICVEPLIKKGDVIRDTLSPLYRLK